jgi:hypothetical protein
MMTITIMDRDPRSGAVTVSLSKLLALLNRRGRSSKWLIRSADASGASAGQLHRAADDKTMLSGSALANIAGHLDQLLEGELFAFGPDDARPWLVIRSVDSSSWDVATDDEAILRQIRSRYSSVYEAGDQDFWGQK